MADDGTAEPVLDYLASGGHGGEWPRLADLAGRASLYDTGGEGQGGSHDAAHHRVVGRGSASATPRGNGRANSAAPVGRLHHLLHGRPPGAPSRPENDPDPPVAPVRVPSS